MKRIDLILLFILLLSSRTNALIDSDKGSGKKPGLDWQIVTNRNFSSEIRAHPHLLLLVTVPWSGEARTLKKDVAHLVSESGERFHGLKLLVAHRNSEKLLAEVLGVDEEITLFYYHNARRFKYQGRLRARSIFHSISHYLTSQSQEVPLKPLGSEEELKTFLQSTDEAVFLAEFCGWSSRLFHSKEARSTENTSHLPNLSENGDIVGDSLTSGNEPFSRMGNHMGIENEGLTCNIENELKGTLRFEGVIWGNKSTSDVKEHCTLHDFHKFESIFPKFNEAAREFFVPPERLRFGLISERSLLPFLGVVSSNTWMFIHWIPGCQNCSKIFRDMDELKNALQTQNSLVMELDGDQSNYYPALSMNRPSIILFIDRLSSSLKIHEESKSSLDVFRRFAEQNNLHRQMHRSHDIVKSSGAFLQGIHGSSNKKTSVVHGLLRTKVSSGQRVARIVDSDVLTIVTDGNKISLDREIHDGEDVSAHELLYELLKKKTSALSRRETKLSLLAKEVGFQLLSEDFEVKFVSPLQEHKDVSEHMHNSDVVPAEMDGHASETLGKKDVRMPDNSDDKTTVSSAEDGDHLENSGIFYRENRNPSCGASDTDLAPLESCQKVPKEKFCTSNLKYDDDGKCILGKDDDSFTCHTEDSLHLQEDYHTTDVQNSIEKVLSDRMDEISIDFGGSCEVSRNSNFEPSGTSSERCNMKMEKKIVSEQDQENQRHRSHFIGSFYVSDGGYRLLKTLTGSFQRPSMVIVDPILQQHYVYEDTDFCHSSLLNFVNKFLNGSLTPYQRSEMIVSGPRQVPTPPFVNLDFHETDSIPRITTKMMSELILGFGDNYKQQHGSLHGQCTVSTSKDVLVLFSNSWCGFCLRLELVVREVYRTLQTFSNVMNTAYLKMTDKPDNMEDIKVSMPSIFYIDCTHNDCRSILRQTGKEESYPVLLLFPAEKKDAVSYEGDVSVNDVIEFLAAQGTYTKYLYRYKGILWTQWPEANKTSGAPGASQTTIDEHVVIDKVHKSPSWGISVGREGSAGSPALDNFLAEERQLDVSAGSILFATAKLLNAPPFDNSSVLIVALEKNTRLEGLIINKQMSWGVVKGLDEVFEPIRHAPLFYGGPVMLQNLPLASLTHKAKEGYSKVYEGGYFGNPFVTNLTIEKIRSGNESASDYWFFLGFSSWEWNQLLNEIAEGAWVLGNSNSSILGNWTD